MPLSISRRCVLSEFFRLRATARALTTSQPARSSSIPPESPSFIRLPDPPQSSEVKRSRVRGFLPVPRKIFPRADGDRKLRPDYIERTLPTSMTRKQPPRSGTSPPNETQQLKAEMTQNRRENLRQSLQMLWERREKDDKMHRAMTSRKLAEKKQARAAPEREDNRLTRTTVLNSILDTKVILDPDRFRRADRSRSRTAAREKLKKEARRDALMNLYISSSKFIVDESGLEAHIDEIFRENYFKPNNSSIHDHGPRNNIWDVAGKPPSITSMLRMSMGISNKPMHLNETEHHRSGLRQETIAEDLTGGKMA